MLCQYLLCFHPLHSQQKEQDTSFPQKCWGCFATSWNSWCEKYSFMLLKKVDQVKRWMKLRIWPVLTDDPLSVWKEPYFFPVIKNSVCCMCYTCLWQAGMPSVPLWIPSPVSWGRLRCLQRVFWLSKRQGQGWWGFPVPTHTLKNITLPWDKAVISVNTCSGQSPVSH